MNDLKEDAQALFDVAREAHQPSSRDHERVLRGVLSRGAIAAGVTTAGIGSAAAKGALLTGRAAFAAKIMAGFVLVGAAGTGAYRVSTRQHAAAAVHMAAPAARQQDKQRQLVGAPAQAQLPTASEPAPAPNADLSKASQARAQSLGAGAADRAARPNLANAPAHDESALEPAQAAARSPAPALAATQDFPTNPAPSPATSSSSSAVTLTREARALADVQRALREGRSADALLMLASQGREFAGGALGQEREAARIVALCGAGRVAEGRAAAERFLTTTPGSPVAARIRTGCGVP
jgi:hypothetical protein